METEEDLSLVRKRLARLGIPISVAHDLYELAHSRDRASIRTAIPELIGLLPRLKPSPVKSQVIGVLGTKEARGVSNKPLIGELRRLRDQLESRQTYCEILGWEIGDSLTYVATDEDFDEISAILRDPRYGRAREMLCYTFLRMKSHRSEAISTLLDILPDEDVTAHAIDTLKKLKAVEAMEVIKEFLDSPQKLVRKEATKALKALSKLDVGDNQKVTRVTKNLPPPTGALAETSVNLDSDDIRSVLSQIASDIENGFGDREIDLIEDHVLLAELDDEHTFDFDIVYEGTRSRLQITTFLDDESSVDMHFVATPELAAAIDARMGTWVE